MPCGLTCSKNECQTVFSSTHPSEFQNCVPHATNLVMMKMPFTISHKNFLMLFDPEIPGPQNVPRSWWRWYKKKQKRIHSQLRFSEWLVLKQEHPFGKTPIFWCISNLYDFIPKQKKQKLGWAAPMGRKKQKQEERKRRTMVGWKEERYDPKSKPSLRSPFSWFQS